MLGSSPLTRGKRPVADDSPVGERLIPAHAGKSGTTRPLASASWAHPHSRGENIVQFAEQAVNAGSSPPTRGKLGVDALNTLDERLIPAHAGKP